MLHLVQTGVSEASLGSSEGSRCVIVALPFTSNAGFELAFQQAGFKCTHQVLLYGERHPLHYPRMRSVYTDVASFRA
jgi:hypothetical protein